MQLHICICTVNQLLFDNLVTATMQESDIVGYLQQIYDNFRTCRTAYMTRSNYINTHFTKFSCIQILKTNFYSGARKFLEVHERLAVTNISRQEPVLVNNYTGMVKI